MAQAVSDYHEARQHIFAPFTSKLRRGAGNAGPSAAAGSKAPAGMPPMLFSDRYADELQQLIEGEAKRVQLSLLPDNRPRRRRAKPGDRSLHPCGVWGRRMRKERWRRKQSGTSLALVCAGIRMQWAIAEGVCDDGSFLCRVDRLGSKDSKDSLYICSVSKDGTVATRSAGIDQ